MNEFIDNNLLDNSINTFNGDDVTAEVISPANSRRDSNGPQVDDILTHDKESSTSDESLIESSLKKKPKQSRLNISFTNKEKSSTPKGNKESRYICDAISQNIIKEKVYQSAIGYNLDPLPNLKFIGIVYLPQDVESSTLRGFPLLPKVFPSDGSDEDQIRYEQEKRTMKEWHEKQVVKFQQSCSEVIEDQEDSFEKKINADYSNFVQQGVELFG